ncbi:GNAT family N-acetyltransferase [Chloroflexi bacterium TSY]|nr:GNAT family N-acetyltransferase [Chloroflexi bacterium TSY]
MTKRKRPDPLVEALNNKRPYITTFADGGNFASMRAAIKHGEILTFSPVMEPTSLQIGDIVMVKWRGGSNIIHLIGDIRDEEFLIVNSLGKKNGWVTSDAILGYVTERIEPTPRPSVPKMLTQLEIAYQSLVEQANPLKEDGARLLSIAADMRWYAEAIGHARWSNVPRLNLWSFEQQLWHITKEAQFAVEHGMPDPIRTLLNHGKEQVGKIAALFAILEADRTGYVIKSGNKPINFTIRNFNVSRDLAPLVNLRNHSSDPNASPITLAQQREELRAPNQRPETDRWVVEETGDPWWELLGQSFGYHTIPERYLAWVEVDRAWRRRGLGSQLLACVVTRAQTLKAEHILIYTDDGDKAAQAFLQKNGFQMKSDSWLLIAPAELEIATPQWPDGFSVRCFAEVQDLSILWQACYGGYGDLWGHGENSHINREKPPETTVTAWITDAAPQGENIFLAFDAHDNVAGICRGFVGEQKEGERPTGLIDAPGIVPAFRHLALQRPLTLTVMQWLRSLGQGPLRLESIGDNAATVTLYQEMGFEVAQHSIAYHLDIN